MQIIRFSTTPDGGSRFSEVELTLPEPYTDQFGNVYQISNVFNPAGSVVVELPDGLDQDWHLAPNRQLVFIMTGRIEVETTDGEIRQWNPGGMFLADDTTGQGHRTRVLEGPVTAVFTRLPDDFDLPAWLG